MTVVRHLGNPAIVGLERQISLPQRVAAACDAPWWSGEYGYWDEDSPSRLTRFA